MSNFREHILALIHDLSEIPFSDALVNLVPDKITHIHLSEIPTDSWEISIQQIPGNLLRFAQNQQKEADINTLCIASKLIVWKNEGIEISTPVLLIPVEWKVNKRKQLLELSPNFDEMEINPVIKRILPEYLNTNLPENVDANSIVSFLENEISLVNEISILKENYLGNFHYHRYHVLRELEGIVRSENQSNTIAQLLGDETIPLTKLQLTPELLTYADVDQQNVFSAFEKGNVVVQGPPGTGKSQVLTNILGKLLGANQKTLVVSEKKVALDVLIQKLEKFKLNPFAFCIHSQTKSKDLFQHLKETWTLLESLSISENRSLMLSEQRISQLQLLLDRLNAKDTIGGISYNDYLMLLEETPTVKETKFSTTVLSIKDWLTCKAQLIELNDELKDLTILNNFKASFFQLEHPDVLLSGLNTELKGLALILGSSQWKSLRKAYESIGRCQLIENESYKIYSRLIDKPREWKKVERNVLLFSELNAQLELYKSEISIWKSTPTPSQIDSWAKSSGFFALRKRKKAIRNLLIDGSINEEIALMNWVNFSALRQEFVSLQSFFRELELPVNLAQLEAGMLFAKHLKNEDQSLMNELLQWSPEKRKKIISSGKKITEIYQSVQTYFDCGDEQNVLELIERKQGELMNILPNWALIKKLPKELLQNQIVATWQEFQSAILQSNWKKAEMLFPELTKFNGKNLSERIQQILAEQESEMKQFAQSLLFKIKHRFDENESLLRKAPQKCSVEEKERRMKLKRGKALLVKEFGKSRAHISIRELLESDASLWIDDLLPWWFATPTQVADHLPLKNEWFDTVVFDEASQIPLPNALGALYRSKRVLIAGDEQQMSPTSYFGNQWKGNDLLHQASFYYSKVPLNHHYRSEHPGLIAFSNKHFYNSKLLVYPSPNLKQAVFSHFIGEGKFVDRKNNEEAKAVAGFLKSVDWSKRIGIVAFSEEQLKVLWEECDASTQDKILAGQEENAVFFKTLEQVQGDEADILVVSMAYAKNNEEAFHLRFGPLNQANGYKRLNVLLTRAVHQLHFFHSVKSADFGISSNEGVNLLRRFLLDLENTNADESEFSFPHQLSTDINKNRLQINNVLSKISSAHELITLHNVLTNRGWILNYHQ